MNLLFLGLAAGLLVAGLATGGLAFYFASLICSAVSVFFSWAYQ